MKAIALLSGGLDSTLAAKLILEQGIGLEAVNYFTPFCTCTSKDSSCMASKTAAEQIGIPLKVFPVDMEYLKMIQKPKHGYGSNMNPCIDCRIFVFKKAKEYMEQTGASFVITGEVLGQRPMSQRRNAISIIDRESGLEGLVLRPLSAQLFEPTIPEKEGWINREKLLAISGRSRKPQIKMAAEKGINDYPCPAGGCLLTDEIFSRKLKDLFKHSCKEDNLLKEIKLLKIGRHFRVPDKTKIIVCRDEKENERIEKHFSPGDVILNAVDHLGPVTLIRGPVDEKNIALAASFTARYSKAKTSDGIKVACRKFPDQDEKIIVSTPISEDIYSQLRI